MLGAFLWDQPILLAKTWRFCFTADIYWEMSNKSNEMHYFCCPFLSNDGVVASKQRL